MALTKIEKVKPEGDQAIGGPVSEPRYPFGTTVSFEDELFDQLGLDSMDIDEEVTIVATAKVIRKSEDKRTSFGQDTGTKVSKEMGFQLTGVNVSSGTNEERIKQLYE